MRKHLIACLLSSLLLLSACSEENIVNPEPAPNDTDKSAVIGAYSDFMSGDRALLETTQGDVWWIPDFKDDIFEYEYTYMDLNKDGIVELIVQMVDDPSGYNAVFHYEDGKLICWNSDSMEGSCRDYPLRNGTMVRQMDFNGTSSLAIFTYKADGTIENETVFFARTELLPPDSNEPCPYYEVNGEEVDKSEYEKQLKSLISDQLFERSDWLVN